jgi:hypothetical protein
MEGEQHVRYTPQLVLHLPYCWVMGRSVRRVVCCDGIHPGCIDHDRSIPSVISTTATSDCKAAAHRQLEAIVTSPFTSNTQSVLDLHFIQSLLGNIH